MRKFFKTFSKEIFLSAETKKNSLLDKPQIYLFYEYKISENSGKSGCEGHQNCLQLKHVPID